MYEIARRLREARVRAGYETPTDAAKVLGLPYQSIVSHESMSKASNRKPKPDALFKYANAYKVSVEWLLGGKVVGYSEPEPAAKVTSKLKPQPSAAKSSSGIIICDRVAAGLWSETDFASQEPIGTVPIAGDMVAFLVEGESMNSLASPGDIAVCTKWEDVGRDVRNGDLVVVERTRGGLAEKTVKRYSNGRLVCESTDPKWKDFSFPLNDGDQIRLLALVKAIYKNV